MPPLIVRPVTRQRAAAPEAATCANAFGDSEPTTMMSAATISARTIPVGFELMCLQDLPSQYYVERRTRVTSPQNFHNASSAHQEIASGSHVRKDRRNDMRLRKFDC